MFRLEPQGFGSQIGELFAHHQGGDDEEYRKGKLKNDQYATKTIARFDSQPARYDLGRLQSG